MPALAPRAALRRRLFRPADLDAGVALGCDPYDLRDVRVQQIDVALPEVAPQCEPGDCAIHRLEVEHVDGIRREEAAGEEVAVAVLMRLPDAEEARRTLGEGGDPALDRPYRGLDTSPDRLALMPRQNEETPVGVDADRDVRRMLELLVLQGVEQEMPPA